MDRTVYQYYPSIQQDYILLQWLERMRHDGELDKIISKGNQSPSTFLNLMGNPRRLWFQLDSLGNLSYACWVEYAMGAMFLSYYAQPAYRKNREVAHFIFDVFESLFSNGIPVICGLIQERPTPEEMDAFLKLHEKMGYKRCGMLPYFFDGKNCHLVALTAEDWAKPNAMKARWQRARSKKAPMVEASFESC